MPRGNLTREGALKRVKTGTVPDPLELGEPSVWEPGHRTSWETGTRRIMGNGYVSVKVSVQGNGRTAIVAEHRLVMERLVLGRELDRDESARHVTDDTLDNRPENLMLYRGGRPADPRAAASATASRAKRKRKRKPRRSTVWALLPVPEEPELVRARTAREAEEKADGEVVAVAVSRVT